jgi:HD-GYP domain-containing protein (c-di-GMP phosphodiesterase class II)
MHNTIFLLTNSISKELIIRNCISSRYEVVCVSKGNLMVEMYKKSPQVLIVDIDSYENQSIEMIQSTLSMDYIPVVYVYSESTKVMDSIKDEVLVPIEKLQEIITPIIKQSALFKGKFDKVMESYNAIDMLNGEAKSFLTKYVNIEKTDIKVIINEMLNLVFAHNLFLTNKPSVVWVLSEKKDLYESTQFELNNDEYKDSLSINIKGNKPFNFDIYATNGFSKNFDVDEFSDISFNRNNFPLEIRNNILEINNFAGFSIGKLILIAMNYKKVVTNYDVGIMKALAINFDLMENIKYKISELEEAFEYTTDALARAAEANDDITGQHIKRVNTFAKLISKELGMDRDFTTKIYNAAQMHDVGKVYIDKNIINKPGKLTDEEFQEMKKHTIYGESIIGDSEHLKMSAEIARSHHEKYDGTGYPDGKKGDEIPIAARIVFLADIYDALRSQRTYKPEFSHDKTYEIITLGDGRVNPEHFDPRILEAFKSIHMDFEKAYKALKD